MPQSDAHEAAAARFTALVQTTSDVVWWTGPAGDFRDHQPGWERFSGQAFEEYRGSSWLDRIEAEDRAAVERLWTDARSGHSGFETEFRRRRHDGVVRLVRLRAAPVLDPGGAIREWVGIETDITDRRTIDRELDRERARLEAVFREAPVLIAYQSGPEHRFELANPAYRSMIADRPLIGLTVREAFPELEGQPFFDLLDDVYRTREPFHGWEVPVRLDRNGTGELSEGWFNFTYQPVVDDAGAVIGILTFAVEVTPQVEARQLLERQAIDLEQQTEELQMQAANLEEVQAELESVNEDLRVVNESLLAGEEQFRTLAESIPQLAWIAHPDGHIFWYNQRWYEYTGTTPQQMEGWGWQSVHDPEVLPSVLERWRASIATGQPFDMEFPLRGADGVFRWFLTRVQPVRDEHGNVQRWFGTNTDVDERRRTLEFLDEAKRQAEAADRAKSSFLAHMSHELRTPINAILGYAQLLELGVVGELTEPQLHHVERILGSSHHLLSIINDILDLTKIEAGAVEVRVRETSIRDLVAEAAQIAEPETSTGEIRIAGVDRIDPALSAHIDADRVRQIVVNLLANALKFSGTDRPIEVRASRARHPETAAPIVRIDIVDQGVGIAPDLQEKIFHPFFQVDSGYTRAGGGTGLGLTISRRLARAMGGDLTVESTVGQGSTFSLWLPAA